ncbi:hypothetical protein [Shinella sp.]|uniref:hypothetical protein n=1 Tax=Shinella sp. TaxID=1870904 RepID=UPI0029BA3CEC|nr:hypothetical protein [Shinella sp.]MDX3973824.1 hypothetical protein [Shinella sp.]
MTENNRTRPLAFDGTFVKAHMVEDARDYRTTGVVTNLSGKPMYIAGDPIGVIPAWRSTILRDGVILIGDRASIVHVPGDINLGGIALDDWEWLGLSKPDFPRRTPLYISAKDIIGQVELNPWALSNHPEPKDELQQFDIQLNLWWAPARTDAGIHNTHSFIELHTQIFGQGRIQLFRDKAGTDLYREISAAPGDTHDPIVWVEDKRTFTYPWHRGWTDTDAIWMAIEFHPTD